MIIILLSIENHFSNWRKKVEVKDKEDKKEARKRVPKKGQPGALNPGTEWCS